MADDDTMADGTASDAVAADDGPVVDHGECPICGVEFDDPKVFRDHLGEVHDLYDEEGASTTLWIPTFAVEPVTAVEPTIPDTPAPLSEPVAATKQKAPVGLLVLVVALIALGSALVILNQSNGGSTTRADGPGVSTGRASASTSPVDNGGATDTASGSDSTSATTEQPANAVATSESATTSPNGAPSETVPVTQPAPPGSTTPVTTAPPASFVAPTTTAAHVDSCTRDHGRWLVTYSWRYVGGAAWAPLATYTALGGGKYQDTASVPANGNTPIATVGVTDTNDKRHDVALSPTLSANSC